MLGLAKAESLFDSPRETLANLSITGHLRGFSDQPGSKSSSAASQSCKPNKISYLRGWRLARLLSLIPSGSCGARAALDDVRNWPANMPCASDSYILANHTFRIDRR
jgi:hypothetical protein